MKPKMHKDKRLAFNFMENYYQVYKRLSDKQKVIFMDALLEVQFLDIKIADVKFDNGMTDMAFHSILHHVQSTIDGYLVQARNNDMFIGVHRGGIIGGMGEEKEKEKETEKEEVQEKEKYSIGLNIEAYKMWIEYKGSKYSKQGKTLSMNKLAKFDTLQQQQMVENSIMNEWKGLVEPKGKKDERKSNINYGRFGFEPNTSNDLIGND